MRAVVYGIAVLLSVVAAGCADLSPISVGVCGNDVVEPARGEDCDGDAPKGATCGDPGTTRACRYVCATQSDCPSDYGCGQDGLCRASSSTWSSSTPAPPQHTPETPLDLVVADADGDGLADVVEEAPDYVTVHYEVTSSTGAELTFPHDSTLPAIGPIADLSGDGLADAVVPADLGFFVSLGNAARVERATAYGAVQLPSSVSDVQAFSADILPDPGSEILVIAVLSVSGMPPAPVIVDVAMSNGKLSFIGVLPDVPSKLAGPVRSGRFDETPGALPCEELVLGYAGKSALDRIVPCKTDGNGIVLAENATSTPLPLPAGAKIAGPVTVEDVDLDGHLDLVVPAVRGTTYEVDVAYGRGDGSFDSTPGADPTTVADGSAGKTLTLGGNVPLAVYDIDGDHRLDWVDATGIYLSRSGTDPVIAAANHQAHWTSAVIARFDGDTLLDVAVGSNQAPGLTVFQNAGGGTLTPFPVQTRGNVELLGAGDFDGDRVGDLATVTTSTETTVSGGATSTTSDTLSVLFGATNGAPNAPKDIGEFHHLAQLATARVAAGDPPVLDGADELGALAQDDDGTLAFAIVFGQGNRDLRCPYDLTHASVNDANVTGYEPFRMTIGDADGDGNPDVLSLGQNIEVATDNRIWATPMHGEASIDLAKSTSSDPVSNVFDWRQMLFGAVDLDGTPGDEVVILGPRADGTGFQTAIGHATAVAGSGSTYAMSTPVSTTMAFSRSESILADPSTRNGRLRVADIDGDGVRDVVVLGQKNRVGSLVVYFNDGTGNLGTPTSPAGMENLDVRDFALVQGAGEKKPRIVMLTTTGVYVVTAAGRALSVGDVPALAMTANTPTSPGLISAGDIDGDGVPDLALGGPLGYEVHLGLSANVEDRR
ncbi:MAG TPA: VCBS repeat-containing protein [Polyangiaceae bacterium]|jgi:hypothetical protein|nr:VCBS repeat-containing protein [Polyangiaceae bacterium]